jgi:hypothetical protein
MLIKAGLAIMELFLIRPPTTEAATPEFLMDRANLMPRGKECLSSRMTLTRGKWCIKV